jgi:hypothetical protein
VGQCFKVKVLVTSRIISHNVQSVNPINVHQLVSPAA